MLPLRLAGESAGLSLEEDYPMAQSMIADSEDRLLAVTYADLEHEVTDLTRMARLAEIQVDNAIGQLSLVDGKYTEPPEAEATDLAVFAVSQMAGMAKRFQELYYSAFKGDPGKPLA